LGGSEDSPIKMSYTGFYYLVNQVVEGGENNLTVKDAIDNTYSYLGIENDFYYDYESLDVILLMNCFELCKSVFLTSYDKGYDCSDIEDAFINSLSLGSVPYSERVRFFRNCLAHDDYDYDGYMSMSISNTWNGESINTSVDIIDFYNYTRLHLCSLHRIWNKDVCINEISEFKDIHTAEDAKEYIQECLSGVSEERRRFISKIVENDDFIELVDVVTSLGCDDVKHMLTRELNEYIRISSKNIIQTIDTFDNLFDFIECVRFHLHYCRQNCLEHQYALISDNYFNYCINHNKNGMYKPNYKTEWEELGGVYKFYLGLDVKQNMNEELEKAIRNFSVFFYIRAFNEDSYFPYDKFNLIHPVSCSESDIKRHLRNSAAHRNYSIDKDHLIFKDYNQRNRKLTFEGSIEYGYLKESILSNYTYLPYEGAYY